MTLAEYGKQDALGLAALVRSGEMSAREIAACALEAIDRLNPSINAVISRTPAETERALAQNHKDAPFAGAPFLVKDVGAHFADIPSECGSRLFTGVVFPYDSELGARFKQAGVVTVGRSNIPEFGANVTTESVKHGPARNPWNLGHSAGGSSGGAAAAVAAGLVPIAHANDGAGSIRVPASCCGVFGLKPSRGRQPAGPDFDEAIFGLGCEHIVSRSVRDTAAMLDVTAGPDSGARLQLSPPKTTFLEASQRDPTRLRIAFSLNAPVGASHTHAECQRAVVNAAKLCEDLGHEVFEATPDVTFEEGCAVFREIAATFMAFAVKSVGAHTGRQPGPDNFEATSRALLEYGRQLSAVDLTEALGVLNSVARKLGGFFAGCDVWLSPVLNSPPLPLGVLNANEEGVSAHEWIRRIIDCAPFCSMFNASGQPAMSVPLHWTVEGLPVGAHFVGRLGEEATLLALAGQLERARPWANRRSPVCVTRLD